MSESQEIQIQSTAPEPPIKLAPSLSGEYEQAVDRLLAQVVNLSDENILHEPTCEICNSPHRVPAEQIWASNKDCSEVKKILQDLGGIRVSKGVIENHMTYHMDRAVREIQKLEYISRIKRLNNFNLSTLERIRLGMSAITERLMGINSIVPDADTSAAEVEKIKSSETSRLMGSLNQMLKLQAEILGEMKNNGELITIPRDQFIRIFNDAILEATTDTQRETIKNILGKLSAINKISQ
ncbi:MAG: hypothetical protein WC375_08670 [Methanomassiliicoccales archaeon]|jgi:hypothetical protein